MSSYSLAEGPNGVVGAWETSGQVYLASLSSPGAVQQTAPPGKGQRKYPIVVVGKNGGSLLAWVDGAGWECGGALEWQVYGADGKPAGAPGHIDGTPVWSLVAAAPRADGTLLIIY